VTEPPKIILYHCLNHSFLSLSDSTEVSCRLCRVKPSKSRVTRIATFIHQNSHEDESKDYILTNCITSIPLKAILLQNEFIA
jgi:hypothetical protein